MKQPTSLEDKKGQTMNRAAVAEVQAKGGEAYSEKGRRNPIRQDTNDLLTALVIAKQPKVVVEVGTGYGTSTLCMAEGLPNDGQIVTYELSPEVAKESNALFHAQNVPAVCIAGIFEQVYRGHAHGVDLVFLDAEKSAYLTHLKLIEPDLEPGAVIIADNVIDREEECRPFLDYVTEKYHAVIIPTECGLLVATARDDRYHRVSIPRD